MTHIALGTIPFGTTVDEATSFAILDRFVEAGGTCAPGRACGSPKAVTCRSARRCSTLRARLDDPALA
ncbi:hypothetical protein AB0B89_05450 [Sphaerisporangium sp. NPDC049002]|uniref:hypothetical protein n=1 Tax=unclassified Sphaerisporangium TaxID=2630420 RepID=UPI0033FC8015